MTIPSSLELNQPKPFLKWVGGKRALVDEIIKRMPNKFNTYFEPFVGGGALFFELKKRGMLEGKKSYLFDANFELINAYNTVKNNPCELIEILKEFQNKHSHDFYYEVRTMDREGSFTALPDAVRSARFIYLNKTCFNGLYRVNSKGFYNVPMGRYKNPAICDTSSILSASRALQEAEVLHVDFAKVLDFAKKGDFVYFDPPYYPLTTTSSFTSYNQDIFLEDEQKRLFNTFEKLAKKGSHVMLSNSDTEFIKELYKDHEIDFVEMNRFINSKSGGRGKIKEILVRSDAW
ncbi:MAG: DNA adenine methylase [Sulfurospirillaceae bacterium]|nr:DNA adenine methylase [Sulfurospirillaceae bacterium]MDD3462569.1 DNA adenine methylase [Sulfurospirillaceae bacterium]